MNEFAESVASIFLSLTKRSDPVFFSFREWFFQQRMDHVLSAVVAAHIYEGIPRQLEVLESLKNDIPHRNMIDSIKPTFGKAILTVAHETLFYVARERIEHYYVNSYEAPHVRKWRNGYALTWFAEPQLYLIRPYLNTSTGSSLSIYQGTTRFYNGKQGTTTWVFGRRNTYESPLLADQVDEADSYGVDVEGIYTAGLDADAHNFALADLVMAGVIRNSSADAYITAANGDSQST